jgi:hypothetical protein
LATAAAVAGGGVVVSLGPVVTCADAINVTIDNIRIKMVERVRELFFMILLI